MRSAVPLLVAIVLGAFVSDGACSEVAGLRFSLPRGWDRVPVGSAILDAQFNIPRARHDKEDGELVLFRFGEAEGGGASDNVARWYSQFTQPDGRSSQDVAVVSTRAVRGFTVKVIDLSGTYRQQMGPMEHPTKPGYRLLAAVVEGSGGPWFWRAVGPAETMAKAKKGFDELIESLDVAP
jgi:hypothetical protein